MVSCIFWLRAYFDYALCVLWLQAYFGYELSGFVRNFLLVWLMVCSDHVVVVAYFFFPKDVLYDWLYNIVLYVWFWFVWLWILEVDPLHQYFRYQIRDASLMLLLEASMGSKRVIAWSSFWPALQGGVFFIFSDLFLGGEFLLFGCPFVFVFLFSVECLWCLSLACILPQSLLCFVLSLIFLLVYYLGSNPLLFIFLYI